MTGLERIILLFDTDPTAFEFMREDGEGGFSGSIFRMAREIDRLRSARAADNIALQEEVERLQAEMSILSPLYSKRQALADENARLREALTGITERYVDLANSGDAGFWDPEIEPEVIAVRAALNATPDTAGGEDGH